MCATIRDSDLNKGNFFIERNFRQLFPVVIIGEVTNSPWHLY